MRSDEEICQIIGHIAANPEEIVDYLTVGDFLQMRQHVVVCEKCSEAIEKTVENKPEEVNINFGGASEN